MLKKHFLKVKGHIFISHLVISILLVLFSATVVIAQDYSRYAFKSFEEQDYYGAAYYFNLSMQNDSVNLDLMWYYAESVRLTENYESAGKAYKELMDLDEKVKYPDAIFYLADMLKRQENYEEAEQYFEFYKDVCIDKTALLYRRSKVEIKACAFAKSMQNTEELIDITHPDFYLNSFDGDYSPYLLNDTHMIFSSVRYDSVESKKLSETSEAYTPTIYEAKFSKNEWQVFEMDSVVNDPLYHNSNPTITPDSTQIYFSRCDDKGCNIWVSNWHRDHWENATIMGPNINEENSKSLHPYVATLKNGKTYLFFASNRSRTRGKMDIWSVEIKGNGTKYGRPKNAGRYVNTKEDEITPYYNVELEELYFSSLWHPGFGGFDIFKAKGLPGKFQEAKNVGKPINSSVNDLYYTYSDSTKNGAFVSNRKDGYALKGETCCNDIYFFGPRDTTQVDTVPVDEIPIEEDLVVKLKAVQFLPLALYFDNDKPNSNSRQTTTETTYEQTFDNYVLRKPTFLKQAPNKANIDSFFVNNVEVGFIKLQMLADSLIKYLDKGYKLQLGVKGFTSPLGDADYNDNLALRRINSIENYLYNCNYGALQGPIDSGLLKFRRIPFGEFFSLGKVSDDLKSKRQSVYSAGASEARKVEIIWVEQTLPGDSNAIAIFESTTHNFGTLPQNEIVSTTFKFTNTGEKPLLVTEVYSNCDCVSTTFPTQEIAPGENAEIKVELNTSDRKGLQFHGLIVKTNAKIPEKKLFIRGVMEIPVEN